MYTTTALVCVLNSCIEQDYNIALKVHETSFFCYCLHIYLQTRLSEPLLPLKLEWKNATESMPFDFSKPPYVVEIKGKVYIGGGESSSQFESEVIVYDLEKDMWSKLLPYQYKFFALTI